MKRSEREKDGGLSSDVDDREDDDDHDADDNDDHDDDDDDNRDDWVVSPSMISMMKTMTRMKPT